MRFSVSAYCRSGSLKRLLMIKILQDKGVLFVHVHLTVRDKFDILPEAVRMQDQKQNKTKTKNKEILPSILSG